MHDVRTREAPPAVALIGPSAVGKSTVARGLQERGVVRVHPTWTTRPRRRSERGAAEVEHHFVGDRDFDRALASGYLVATGTVAGLPYRYGLPRAPTAVPGSCATPAGRRPVPLLVVRAPYVVLLRELVPGVLVCQLEVDAEVARDRLRARTLDEHERAARLEAHRAETGAGRDVADRVFRNDGSIEDLLVALTRVVVGLPDAGDGPGDRTTA